MLKPFTYSFWLFLFGLLGYSNGVMAQFDFQYSGPDTIAVSATCQGAIAWDPSELIVTSTIGNTVTIVDFNELLTGHSFGDSIALGTTITVVHDVLDDMGTTGQYSFDLYFGDLTKPYFPAAPRDTILTCFRDFVAPDSLVAFDDCDGSFPKLVPAVLENGVPPSGCGNVILTYSWTVVDSTGNERRHEQLITVLADTIRPTATISFSPDTVVCGTRNFSDWVSQKSQTIANSSSDNCTAPFVTYVLPAGADTLCGATTVDFLVQDSCNNALVIPATYVVKMESAVFSNLPSDTVIYCPEALPLVSSAVAATSPCGAVTLSFDSTVVAGACAGSFTLQRTWTATDACGFETIAQQEIEVIDTLAPSFVVPDTVRLSFDTPADTALTGVPTAIVDVCGSASIITFTDLDIVGVNCPVVATTRRVWKVEDACGNVDSAAQIIEFIDVEAPSFTVPSDRIIQCYETTDTSLTGSPTNGVDNFFATPIFTFRDSIINNTCGQDSLIFRFWSAADSCLNRSTQIQQISVQDTFSPVVNGPASTDYFATGDSCTVEVAFIPPSVRDSCINGSFNWTLSIDGGLPIMGAATDTLFEVLPIGLFTIEYAVADCSGNIGRHSFTVTVQDTTAPIVNCPADLVFYAQDTVCTPLAMSVVVPISATDNCDLPAGGPFYSVQFGGTGSFVAVDPSLEYPYSEPGVYPTQFLVADQFGNQGGCSHLVELIDTTPPQMRCAPAVIELDPGGTTDTLLTAGLFNDGTFDNCRLATLSVSLATVDCSNIDSTLSIIITGQDGSGNMATCNTTLTVNGAPPNPSYTIEDCGATLQLAANAPSVTHNYTYSWQGPNGFTAVNERPTIAIDDLAVAGTYRVTVTGDSGCSTVDSVEVLRSDLPFLPVLNGVDTACGNQPFQLVVDSFPMNTDTFLWYETIGGNQVLLGRSTANTFTVAPTATLGSRCFTVQLEDDQNCLSFQSAALCIPIYQPTPVLVAFDSLQVCADESVQLSASVSGLMDSFTVQWAGPNSFMSSELMPAEITSIATVEAGIYVVEVQQTGCAPVRDTSFVEVFSRPAAPTFTTNSLAIRPICAGDTLRFSLTGNIPSNLRWVWNGPNGFVDTVALPALIIPNADATFNGSWSVQALSQNCISEPSVVQEVVIAEQPIVTTQITPQILCLGAEVQLTAAATVPSTFVWQGPNGFDESGDTVMINDIQTSQEGRYFVRATTANGCFDTASVLIDLQPIVLANPTLSAVACAGDPIELSVQCMTGATYQWNGPNGFSSSLCTPRIPSADSVQHSGTYTVRLRVGACWSDTGRIDVIVNPLPVQPVLNALDPVCTTTSDLVLNASSVNNGLDYYWYDEAETLLGISVDTSRFVVPGAVDLGNSSASFFVRSYDGLCLSLPSALETVDLNTVPSIVPVAGIDTFACAGSSFEANADMPSIGTGAWSIISGDTMGVMITSPGAANAIFSGLRSEEDYALRWSLSNGACMDYAADTLAVRVRAVEFADAGADIDTCQAAELQLSGNLPAGYLGVWSQPIVQQNLGIAFADSTDVNTIISGLRPSNLYLFTWTLLNNGCGASVDNVLVRIGDLRADGGIDQTLCDSLDCIRLAARNPSMGSGQWAAPDPLIEFTDVNSPITEVCGLAEGENILIWSLVSGTCDGYGGDTVVVDYSSAILLSPDELTVQAGRTDSVNLFDNDDFVATTLFSLLDVPALGDVVVDSVSGRLVFTAFPGEGGVETLRYEVCKPTCDCEVSDLTITVSGNASCPIPNIFTPNGDGQNDAFIIPCFMSEMSYPNNQLLVYNQWGNEVFKAAPYRNDWSPTNLPEGTYYYVVNRGDGSPGLSGFVVIKP